MALYGRSQSHERMGCCTLYSTSSAMKHPSHLGVRHLHKAPATRAELRQFDGTQVIALKPFSMTSFARCAASLIKYSKNTYTLTSRPPMLIYTKQNLFQCGNGWEERDDPRHYHIYSPLGLPSLLPNPHAAKEEAKPSSIVPQIVLVSPDCRVTISRPRSLSPILAQFCSRSMCATKLLLKVEIRLNDK